MARISGRPDWQITRICEYRAGVSAVIGGRGAERDQLDGRTDGRRGPDGRKRWPAVMTDGNRGVLRVDTRTNDDTQHGLRRFAAQN